MAVGLCRLSLLSVTTKKAQCTLKCSDPKMCQFRPPVFCFKFQTRFRENFRQILTEQRCRHVPQESRIEAIFSWSTKYYSRLLSISLIICHEFVMARDYSAGALLICLAWPPPGRGEARRPAQTHPRKEGQLVRRAVPRDSSAGARWICLAWPPPRLLPADPLGAFYRRPRELGHRRARSPAGR
jgi:hypothetical protein